MSRPETFTTLAGMRKWADKHYLTFETEDTNGVTRAASMGPHGVLGCTFKDRRLVDATAHWHGHSHHLYDNSLSVLIKLVLTGDPR